MRRIGLNRISRSIFIKFVMAFIAVGLIPLIILGYLFLEGLSKQAEGFNNDNLDQMLFYLAKSTDQLYGTYNQISQILYFESRYELLKLGLERGENEAIEEMLLSVLGSDSYIENAYFFSANSERMLFTTRKAKLFQSAFQTDERLREIVLKGGTTLMFLGIHPDLYNNSSDLRVMTFGRNLIDKDTVYDVQPRIMGTLLMDVRVDSLNRYFRNLSLGRDDHISLIDKNGEIYYSTRDDMVGKPMFDQNDNDSSIMRMEAQPIESTGHWLVGSFTKKDFFGVIEQFKTISIPLVAMSLVFLVILSFVTSRRLSQPIQNMIQHMRKMEDGNLELQMEVKSEDELGQLVRGMNRMSNKLHDYIQVAYVARMKQERAELDALKSQIRPHYLYNTLEVIRMNAVENDDDTVADMIHALASQLDYVIDYGESIVSLRDELNNVRHYFGLIKMLYEDRVELSVAIDSSITEEYDLGVIKLSIQPLVENAVEHGLLKLTNGGIVELRVEIGEGNLLIIEVEDNGAGIEPHQLRFIRDIIARDSSYDQSEELHTHRGIRNVHGRIRALCGVEYGLEIESRLGHGTVARIIIPVKRKEDWYDISCRIG